MQRFGGPQKAISYQVDSHGKYHIAPVTLHPWNGFIHLLKHWLPVALYVLSNLVQKSITGLRVDKACKKCSSVFGQKVVSVTGGDMGYVLHRIDCRLIFRIGECGVKDRAEKVRQYHARYHPGGIDHAHRCEGLVEDGVNG